MTTQKKKLEKSLKTKDFDSRLEKKTKSLDESISLLETKLSWVKINGDKSQIEQLEKIIKRFKDMR